MTRTPDIVRVEINHLRELLNNATEKNKEYENKIAELEAKLDVYHKNLEHSTESKMFNYIFAIKEYGENIYLKEFKTDRTSEWTKSES